MFHLDKYTMTDDSSNVLDALNDNVLEITNTKKIYGKKKTKKIVNQIFDDSLK